MRSGRGPLRRPSALCEGKEGARVGAQQEKDGVPCAPQQPAPEGGAHEEEKEIIIRRSLKERLYEHFRRVPVKYIDWFIGACVAAIVLFTILGMLKGRGYF